MSEAMQRNLRHPVWEVYDDYRTAVMNLEIQKVELKKTRRLSLWIEIPLAITASSTVAGLWFWQSAIGGYAWKILGIVSALLAVIKPLLKLPEKIQTRGEMFADICTVENELEKIKKAVTQTGKYDRKLRQQYLKVVERKGAIKSKYAGVKYLEVNEKIKSRCKQIVAKRFPASNFYIPED